jgi:preprotein translocase subunit SecY
VVSILDAHMISAFTNTLKIPELRQRILFTLAMVVIVRMGAHITIPGVNGYVLAQAARNLVEQNKEDSGGAAVLALFNVFSGGGLQNAAVFALGIMPYISASIMMQLLTAVVPQLSKLAREDGGRMRINQYTRYVAIGLCVFQGIMLARSLASPENNNFLKPFVGSMANLGPLVPNQDWTFYLTAVATITAGTMLLMWIGDQVTERGIGNGTSLIITVNIVFSLPGALVQVWQTYINPTAGSPLDPIKLVALIFLLLLVIGGVIAITQATRRIPIHYAKRVVGRKTYGGQTQYLPLKINYSGVMPIIFAQAILLFPVQILSMALPETDWVKHLTDALNNGWQHYVISALLIFFFSYFWVATMFQPQQIAEDLKKNGGYIPGHRPGKPTADFLDYTMGRLTFAGAIFLTLIAVMPTVMSRLMGVPPIAAQFFGGTSVLILVGVLLDVMRQVETHLIQRHYDGFLRKGRIRGRSSRPVATGTAPSSGAGMVWLYVVVALLFIVGMTYFVMQRTPH